MLLEIPVKINVLCLMEDLKVKRGRLHLFASYESAHHLVRKHIRYIAGQTCNIMKEEKSMCSRNVCGSSCGNNNVLGRSGMFTDYVPVTVSYTITPANYEVTGQVIANNGGGNGNGNNNGSCNCRCRSLHVAERKS